METIQEIKNLIKSLDGMEISHIRVGHIAYMDVAQYIAETTKKQISGYNYDKFYYKIGGVSIIEDPTLDVREIQYVPILHDTYALRDSDGREVVGVAAYLVAYNGNKEAVGEVEIDCIGTTVAQCVESLTKQLILKGVLKDRVCLAYTVELRFITEEKY